MRRALDSKNFGLIIGLVVFVVIGWFAFASPFQLFSWWDRSFGDLYFKLKTAATPVI